MHEPSLHQPCARRWHRSALAVSVSALLTVVAFCGAPAAAPPLRLAQAETPAEAEPPAEESTAVSAEELLQMGIAAEEGEDPDYAAALDFYTRATLGGHPGAMLRLARFYDEGLGVGADREEAKRLYYEAARRGNADGQYIFATRYAESEDARITWLWHATIRGHTQARDALLASDAFADTAPPPIDADAVQLEPADGVKCVQAALNALGFDAGPVDGLIGSGTTDALAGFVGDREGQIAETPLNPVTAVGWCLFIHRVAAADLESGDEVETIRNNAVTELTFDVPQEVGFTLATFQQGTLQDAFRPDRTVETPVGERPAVRLMFRDLAASTQICLLFEQGWGVRLEDGSPLGTFCIALVPEMMAARGFFFPVPLVSLNDE